ncbi:hypothetical protein HC931_25515 [Candidatus Gracilibacteria bacterium]|nr:hypothetical protein [Candidatus Gracilibacteria bacterium]NJM90437.1 hypothetical protein [Hydrococcus sp. RU_2_2]
MYNITPHRIKNLRQSTVAFKYYKVWQLCSGDVICFQKTLKRKGIDLTVKVQTTVVSVRQIKFLEFEITGKANLVTAPNGKQEYRAEAVSYCFSHDFVVGALVKH